MRIYTLEREQLLPIDIHSAWEFFSAPHNLGKITPEWMNFTVLSPVPEKMHPGMVVRYHVHPLGPLPVQWVTEITHVREPHFFVDEQRFGPYKFWHHQHHFTPVAGGVKMHDLIHYALPLGPLGRILHHCVVQGKLNAIFSYRYAELQRCFGSM
ncbi:MAG: SRPBCC family protein [Desulfuromonadaceae bacterium]